MLDGYDLSTVAGRADAAALLSGSGWGDVDLGPDPSTALERLVALCPLQVRHELGCRFAERVLALWHAAHPFEERPRRAIEAKLDWLQDEGDVEDEQLRELATAAEELARGAPEPSRSAGLAAAAAAVWIRDQGTEVALSAASRALEATTAAGGSADDERRAQLRLVLAYLFSMGPPS